MVLFDDLGMPSRPPVLIRAVDISTKALTSARKGIYSVRASRVFPATDQTLFSRTEPGRFTIVPELRRAVEFERANLIEPLADTRTFP